MKIFGYIVLAVLFFTIMSAGCYGCKYIQNAKQTAFDEFKPSELLRKYEWFKDAASQLDQKINTLSLYEKRFHSIKETYGADSTNRKVWLRDDREQYNIWESEYTGIAASYNELAAEYNSQMSKFNWRFCNAGGLPKGQTEVLPREFRTYLY